MSGILAREVKHVLRSVVQWLLAASVSYYCAIACNRRGVLTQPSHCGTWNSRLGEDSWGARSAGRLGPTAISLAELLDRKSVGVRSPRNPHHGPEILKRPGCTRPCGDH